MAQLVVRNIEENVKDGLRRLARRHGRSMEAEAREILRQAILTKQRPATGAGTQISSLFKDLDIEFEIPEMRGEQVRAPKLPK